ncbi:hypothetical protein H6F90_00050 [Trichocoleus sp. FACHB-591]|uniref:hypothetical protein n=1 Tax=Trichocoleus sp. FACHB-591 TaxID=2692872 RepID=UPI0016889AFF|nr:hypothetical protein [Trichocoleus sp. FACHB-591]MBD2093548.1 hypothetical protein [Trichocoleus sp. FACHB-591]
MAPCIFACALHAFMLDGIPGEAPQLPPFIPASPVDSQSRDGEYAVTHALWG